MLIIRFVFLSLMTALVEGMGSLMICFLFVSAFFQELALHLSNFLVPLLFLITLMMFGVYLTVAYFAWILREKTQRQSRQHWTVVKCSSNVFVSAMFLTASTSALYQSSLLLFIGIAILFFTGVSLPLINYFAPVWRGKHIDSDAQIKNYRYRESIGY